MTTRGFDLDNGKTAIVDERRPYTAFLIGDTWDVKR